MFDLLTTLKLLCMRLWQNMVSGVDELRLEVALKMLKSPHFNAKMNSLKEVCVEEALILITSAVK